MRKTESSRYVGVRVGFGTTGSGAADELRRSPDGVTPNRPVGTRVSDGGGTAATLASDTSKFGASATQQSMRVAFESPPWAIALVHSSSCDVCNDPARHTTDGTDASASTNAHAATRCVCRRNPPINLMVAGLSSCVKPLPRGMAAEETVAPELAMSACCAVRLWHWWGAPPTHH